MLTSETQTDGQPCLLTIISDPGKADAMARFALKNGALTAYHFFAHGTVPGHLLALLGLSGVRREMVSLTVPRDQGHALLDKLCQHFHIGREMNGIVFLQFMDSDREGDPRPDSYVMITAVVNEGEGEYVVESARRCHPVGATILRALGTADHSEKSFDFEIVPQKEVVLIIARSCYADALYRAIYEDLRTDQPGRGIIFSLALDGVAGLLDMIPDCTDLPDEPDTGFMEPLVREDDYVALLAVADRGHTAEIMEAVERCGGTGATVLHCRMATPASGGWYKRLGDPEKEVALIITQPQKANRIKKELMETFDDQSGQPLPVGQLKVDRFVKLSGLRDAP